MILASRRCIPGVSGLGSGPTALTKTRRPSSTVSRAATPGEKPVGCVTASTTVPPSHRSIAARTRPGISAHSSLTPRSGGGVPSPFLRCPLLSLSHAVAPALQQRLPRICLHAPRHLSCCGPRHKPRRSGRRTSTFCTRSLVNSSSCDAKRKGPPVWGGPCSDY